MSATPRERLRRSAAAALLGVGLPATIALAATPVAARPGDGSFDLRARAARYVPAGSVAEARRRLRVDLGARGVVTLDPASGRPRVIGDLSGTLTGPSTDTNAAIATRYVRAHRDVYGLSERDVTELGVGRQTRSGGGLRTIQLTQSLDGVPSIDSGLRASIAPDGRLIALTGAPDPDLDLAAPPPRLSAADAVAAVRRALGVPTDVHPAAPRQIIFHLGPTARRGWRLMIPVHASRIDDVIIDGTSGTVVRRANLVRSANAASVFGAWPGAPLGGTPTTVDLAPYLDHPDAPTRLRGPYAHAFTDEFDLVPGSDETLRLDPPPSGEVGPSSGKNFTYPLAGFPPTLGACPPAPATCTWDPQTAFSWRTNREQDAVQLFWLVNRFHDHLAAAPIGFTASDGGFEGDDPIVAQSLDGANWWGDGIPFWPFLDNASFWTLPDGFPGFLQSYLFGGDRLSDFFSVSASDDASIVYHEYTHGLSGRLVTDADGFEALDTVQAGAMGEAWSDWYGFDALDRQQLLQDQPDVPDLRAGAYVEGTRDLIRTEPIDCPVGAAVPACNGDPGGSAGPGGYTYGDFGRIAGYVEVHADGEIWGQTLWQLREGLIADLGRSPGIERAERLVTDAMRLSPPQPSFLDMRNAILQADAADAPSGSSSNRIWQVFASRGMGWFASTNGSDDDTPIEDFSLPPSAAVGAGQVQGVVSKDGATVAGVAVTFGGHDTGIGPTLAAVTDADGRYAIGGVPVGTYPVLRAAMGDGFVDNEVHGVAVARGVTTTVDMATRRNWASGAGGARVYFFGGPDESADGCGPEALIDDDLKTAWSTHTPGAPSVTGPANVLVELPTDITVTGVEIDPDPACGDDDPSAELGDVAVRAARANGGGPGEFTTFATGTFGPADLGLPRPIHMIATAAGTRFIDVQVRGNNGHPVLADVAELRVFGHPTTDAEGGGGTAAPAVTTLEADPAGTSSTRVTFRASVTPHGAPTVAHVAFGLSPGQLVQQTADVPAVGLAPQTVSIAADGLVPGTTYYYRAVATNALGSTTGDLRQVTTSAAPAAALAGQGPAPLVSPPKGTPRQRVAGRVRCRRRDRRHLACTFTSGTVGVEGARLRVSRNHLTYAVGLVHRRAASLTLRRKLKAGRYRLSITPPRGQAESTTVKL